MAPGAALRSGLIVVWVRDAALLPSAVSTHQGASSPPAMALMSFSVRVLGALDSAGVRRQGAPRTRCCCARELRAQAQHRSGLPTAFDGQDARGHLLRGPRYACRPQGRRRPRAPQRHAQRRGTRIAASRLRAGPRPSGSGSRSSRAATRRSRSHNDSSTGCVTRARARVSVRADTPAGFRLLCFARRRIR